MRELVLLLTILVGLIHCQDRGNPCVLENGQAGHCELFNNCSSASIAVRAQERPKLCGFEGKTPVVCCEKQLATLRIYKSEEVCNVLYPIPKDPVFAVYSGQNASPRKYPHMAALGYGSADDIKWHCGGSLVSEQFILTAAHCLISRTLGEVKYVRLGDLNLKIDTDDAAPQNFNIKRRIKHPSYTPKTQYNDIALIELDRPVEFTQHVRPACIHTNREPEHIGVQATGWGTLGVHAEQADHLQEVYLSIVEHDKCKGFYTPTTRLPNGIQEDSQICAGGEGRKDTCPGDSGGPLQLQTHNRMYGYTVIGITSFGKACGITSSPGVYTRVYNYIDWIESIIWPN